MLRLPPEFQSVISVFSAAFSQRVWCKANLLLIGAICCPGSRTICNLLRSVGLVHTKSFSNFHRFLNRDRWSALHLSSVLVGKLMNAFLPTGAPAVFGLDETIERRWGAKISKRGIYRDAVRSSQSHFVKCSGLRWMSLMLLTPLPWLINRFWALPVLTALCPSEQYWQKRSQPRSHKTLMNWASQILCWVSRYTKNCKRKVYVVGDGSYATYELMGKSIELGVGLVVRMRMDARLFHFPPPPVKGKRGPKPKIGKRILGMHRRLSDQRVKWTQVVFSDWYGQGEKTMLITTGVAIWSRNSNQKVPLRWVLVRDPDDQLDPVLIGCTDQATAPIDIVRYSVRRWRVEVTFSEVRRHLGVETQRQWSDLAIERSTPLLMGLKSVVCLLALPLFKDGKIEIEQTAWYQKRHFTFTTILSAVRQRIWATSKFSTSTKHTEVQNLMARVEYLEYLITKAAA